MERVVQMRFGPAKKVLGNLNGDISTGVGLSARTDDCASNGARRLWWRSELGDRGFAGGLAVESEQSGGVSELGRGRAAHGDDLIAHRIGGGAELVATSVTKLELAEKLRDFRLRTGGH
jgi:hypothetical protein